jgi:hypothetical protein
MRRREIVVGPWSSPLTQATRPKEPAPPKGRRDPKLISVMTAASGIVPVVAGVFLEGAPYGLPSQESPMSKGREFRFFEFVNRPYDEVRTALENEASDVFRTATHAAEARAGTVAAALRVQVAGIEIGTNVAIRIHDIEEIAAEAGSPPTTRIQIEWEAAKAARWFPSMKAEFAVYPLTPTETQLDLQGRYEPPLGALGQAMDATILHRIAEASVHQFVRDIGRFLRCGSAE